MADQTDNLEIGVGLPGFENVEARLDRLNELLEKTAATAERAFNRPSSSVQELAVHIAKVDRLITSTASKYASFGKAGAAGFELINKQQIESLDKLTKLQAKLRDLDEQRKGSKTASEFAKITKEVQNLEAQLEKVVRTSHSLQTLDIVTKLRSRIEGKPGGEKFITQGAFSIYKPGADKELQKALTDIDRLQRQRKQWESDYTRHVNQESDKQYKARTQRFQNYVKDALAGIRQITREESKSTGRRIRGPVHDALSEFGLGGLSGALGPVAAIAAGGYAIKKGVDLAQTAIEKASEQARANRTLASSAAEAGIGIGKLNEENEKFAKLAALSDVKATSTVAKITQLATLTQRPESIDKLIRGFANLGAARGLDATGIETVVQQIITGQDEGYKKLLLPNPSQLQARFAQAQNRTVASLTAVEKAKIFQDEFLKKAELFNGAAEARLQSVDGRAAKLNATIENLGYSLSTNFANNYDVITFIDSLTEALGDVNKQVDDLASKVERGINIDQLIKDQSGAGILGGLKFAGNTLLSGAASLFSGLGSAGSFGLSNLTGYNQELGRSANASAERALADINPDLREDFLRQQVNAQLRQRALNRQVENERRIQIAADRAEEERLRRRDLEEKRLTEVFSNPRASAESVLAGLSQIRDYQDPAKKALDVAKIQEESLKRFSARDTALDLGRTVDQIMQGIADQVAKEMQAALDVENLPLFDEDSKKKLIKDGEKVLEEIAKKSRELIDGVRESLVESLSFKTENPYISLLSEAETAAENARRKFAQLGPVVADSMGKVAEAQIRTRIAVAEFESSDRALRFTQQGRREAARPYTQTNAFQRRLATVEEQASFVSTTIDLDNSLKSLEFYGNTQVGGKTRKIREAFLRNQFGAAYQDLIQGARGTREEKDAYREVGVRVKQALESLSVFETIDQRGTGTIGSGRIAQSLLDRLPTEEELLPRLRVPGRAREEAQRLLRQRADLTGRVRSGREEEFNQFIANQKFLDLSRKEAEEQAKLLETQGGALTDKAKLDKFLSITQELGPEELTPELRERRIKALDARAEIERKEKDDAQESVKKVSEFIDSLKKQTEGKGIKVDLGETPLVNLNVNAAGVEATLDQRPTQNRGR